MDQAHGPGPWTGLLMQWTRRGLDFENLAWTGLDVDLDRGKLAWTGPRRGLDFSNFEWTGTTGLELLVNQLIY